jgi:hypothetical protein
LKNRDVQITVVDKSSELGELVTTFREAGTRALEDEVIGLTHLINTAEKVLLISAQMQDSDIHWATDMMTTETRDKQHVLLLGSGYVPRATVTWKVKDCAHLRILLKDFLDKGHRVACFCGTVKRTEKTKAWFDSVYADHNKQARCFTADVNTLLQKKGTTVGEYAQDCDLFLYTIGLGLGMNLLPVFHVRFMVADVGFISAKRLSQAAGRPRNCVLPDLYICIGNSGWQNAPGDGITEMAEHKVMTYHLVHPRDEHWDKLHVDVVDPLRQQ